MGLTTGFESRQAGRACLAFVGATCALVVVVLAVVAGVLAWKIASYMNPKVKAEAGTSASFPARDVKRIRLDVKVGGIRVDPGSGDQITVDAKRHAGGPTKEAVDRYLALSQVKMTNANGTLIIEDVPADDHADDIAHLANRGLDLTVRVPNATDIEATTGVGNVTVSGAVRDLSVESGVGTITLEDVRPHGDTVRAHAGTGSINVSTHSLPRRSLTADTGVGSVILAIPADARASVDLSTGVGNVESAFTLKRAPKAIGDVGGKMDGDLNGGGPEVRATVGTGSIGLRRGSD